MEICFYLRDKLLTKDELGRFTGALHVHEATIEHSGHLENGEIWMMAPVNPWLERIRVTCPKRLPNN